VKVYVWDEAVLLIVGPLRVKSDALGTKVPLTVVLLKSRTMGLEVSEVVLRDNFTAESSRKLVSVPVVNPDANVFVPDVMFEVNPAGSWKSLLNTVPAFAEEMATREATRANPASVRSENRENVGRMDIKTSFLIPTRK